jgi:sarcosine oxidase
MRTMTSVIVVGAGCFGAWTAYCLARAGHTVTLLDAYGPGNSRSSSGGESRIIRMSYGAQEIYTRWSWRSLGLWKSLFERTATPLFRETGVLWMARAQDPLSTATLATLERVGVPYERLARAQLESRWPQIDFGAIAWAIYEPGSGVLMARRAVAAVVREAVSTGVHYTSAAVNPAFARGLPGASSGAAGPAFARGSPGASYGAAGPPIDRGRLQAVTTRSGDTIGGDTFVFACGPWLPKLFPDLLRDRIFTTRQEVIYVGPPAGDDRFAPPALPAWIDFGEEMYGIPDIEARGFKISLDRHGPPFDPDTGDRVAGETFSTVRAYLTRRFPALRDAPIVAAEVCQYENTSNGDFLIDRHPAFQNVWLVGGGSGHGFKHGPAVGEYVARLVTEHGTADDRFRLSTKENVQQRAVY